MKKIFNNLFAGCILLVGLYFFILADYNLIHLDETYDGRFVRTKGKVISKYPLGKGYAIDIQTSDTLLTKVYFPARFNLMKHIQVGDSVLKDSNSLTVKVFNGAKLDSFEYQYGYTENDLWLDLKKKFSL